MISSSNKKLTPEKQDLILNQAIDHVNNKGFVIAKLENLVNWARTGSLYL